MVDILNDKEDWSRLEAITFDVDATLYNYPRMMIPRLHRWGRYVNFLMHLTKARQIIRKEGHTKDYRKRQAEILAEIRGTSYDEAYRMADKVLYNGWNVDFKKVKPYKGAKAFIRRAVDNGIKIGIITDYPPYKKLEYMGFMDLPWDVMVECEKIGELKPAPRPYRYALKELGLAKRPGKVMHIGDSYNYDIKGAKRVGMKAAWLCRKWRFSKMVWGEEDTDKQLKPDFMFKKWPGFDRVFSELAGWD